MNNGPLFSGTFSVSLYAFGLFYLLLELKYSLKEMIKYTISCNLILLNIRLDDICVEIQ